MKTMMFALALSAACIAAPAIAQMEAQPHDRIQGQVDRRQANQQDRIQQGVDNGDITHHEAQKLEKQQLKIAHKEDNMRADHDGDLSHHQRKVLHKRQHEASKDIRKAETNDHVQ